MIETEIDSLVSIAKRINSEGKNWHFHMLTPDCMFNQREDKQAFILEDSSGGETCVVYSNERYMDIGKELVELLHGKTITKRREGSKGIGHNIEVILEKARELNKKGVRWHHHMLFPVCIFNKHIGKWNIVFEDKEESRILESISDNEPVNNLREIEILYYKQKP